MKTRYSLSILIASGLLACKTSQQPAASVEAVDGSDLTDTLVLAKDEAQALYLLMNSVELNSGVKVAKDQLHATRGVAHCRRDTEPQTCQILVRLPDQTLGTAQPLTATLVEKLNAFAQAARPEINKEKSYLIAMDCDYLGKKSPPYDVEDVSCRAQQPRLPREAVFSEPIAIELADDLRGETAVGDQRVSLVGTLACRFAEGSHRPACMVRAMKNGVLTERVLEVSSNHAPTVARVMSEAVTDFKTVGGGDAKTSPKELIGAMVCVVDARNAGADGSGHRRYQCRVTL